MATPILNKKIKRKVDKLRADPYSKFSECTLRQQGFIEDSLKTGNKRKAVQKNYNVKNPKSATALATNIMKSPKVREAIAEIYATEGADRQKAARVLNDAMGATEVCRTVIGLVKTNIPDHRVRMEGAKTMIKVLGDDVHTKESESKHLHVHVNTEEADRLEDVVLEVLEKKFGKKAPSQESEVVDVSKNQT